MTRFTLPGGRWRYLVPGALFVIAFLSLHSMPMVISMFEDFGNPDLVPLRVKMAASPWWTAGWIALAVLAVATGSQRRDASAWFLAATTALLLVAAAFTLWSALAVSCAPLGEVFCCFNGPIR